MCEPHVKRKALLVGISDDGSGQPLPAGPRNDVLQMRKLLINKYKFEKADIVDMYDKQKEKRPHLVPTRENILREIRNLVKDCQPGDRFLFHYSGHAGQQENLDGSELDGLDECLETKTGRILDDELKAELVDRLCPGSQLVAIFDACHSATLTGMGFHS
ncbi:Ca(2+)-dependent cysteine protease [Pleurotus pulmonarius]|nr:Ca(2+)-dependent cysteine protease [Pleurotus pulmonarius]KAF4583832.1 Ca(2+)-dependent cysteine protease [Pleurotus pulmonarius]